VDNGQLRAGSAGIVAIINLQIINFLRGALRLRYWSPLAFVNE
jgi:hypothetical protein